MARARWVFGFAPLALACSTPPRSEVRPVAPPARTPVAPAPMKSVPVEAVVAPAAPGPNRTRVPIKSDEACTFEWGATTFEPVNDGYRIAGISRIATLDDGACVAAVLFDLDTGEGTPCELEPDPAGCLEQRSRDDDRLDGGVLSTRPLDGNHELSEIDLRDLNFDGFADLCVRSAMGAYNYGQVCYLFDPQQRAFKRYPKLDEVIWATLDVPKKRVASSLRIGGPLYHARVYAWERGELVLLSRVETTLGEKPDGSALPKGYDSWEVAYERRGGVLSVVRRGPTKHR